jgi:Fe-S-cluster containining protein
MFGDDLTWPRKLPCGWTWHSRLIDLRFPIMPVFLECQRCTACCRWPGQVRLTAAEITQLAAFRGLSDYDFIQQFTRLTQDRRGLALLDKPNGECVFLEGGDCVVQSVKPQQCRDFPNLWNFPGAAGSCHAISRTVDEAEHIRLVAGVTGRSPADVAEILRRGRWPRPKENRAKA